MTSILSDLRYGLRMLLKEPGFTAVAVIALALGIGANSAIFSVVNTVLLRPLPYKDPDRLVVFRERKLPEFPEFSVASGNVIEWQKQSTSFEQIEAAGVGNVNLTGRGEPEWLSATRMTTGTLSMLGVRPAIGRDFTKEEGEPGHDNVTLLSYGLWQRKFGGESSILGQSVDIDNEPCVVIGVMPPSFEYQYYGGDLWLPLTFDARAAQNHGGHSLTAAGRLKPGVTIEQARADMDTIARRLQDQYESDKGWDVLVTPMLESKVGPMKLALWILLSAVGIVLLIACANIANLLLARATARQREIAIRNALGAKPGRIVRQLLTESLLLAIMGGAAGLLLASLSLDVLLKLAPQNLPRIQDVSLDGRAIEFTILLTLATGILFGLVPAFHASRPNLMESLKDGGRGMTGGGNFFRSLLVISEIGLAMLLLVGAGLATKSLLRLTEVNPGFNPKNLLIAGITLPGNTYREPEKRIAFFRQLVQQLSTVPGVTSAGLTNSLPILNDDVEGFHIEGEPPQADGYHFTTNYYVVSSDYFRTMEIPILQGRGFTDRDVKDTQRVAVISETFAKRFFPNENPIGKKISINDSVNYREVVGIVGDVKQYGPSEQTPAEFYDPYGQISRTNFGIVIRTTGNPASYGASLRAQVQSIDKDQPVSGVMTMESIMGLSIARQRFLALLLNIFGGLALVLSSVGIYGVMAYAVTQRTTEMGLRMALGAQRIDVLKLVIGQGMVLALIGLVLGLVASFFLTHLIEGQLFDIHANDPVTYAEIVLILSFVAFLASFIPASRATKVDPMLAMRHE